jgi:outer membrane protein TolC
MTDVKNPHEPTEEFRNHLEWEIVRALRRDAGAPLAVVQSRWRFLRAAALVLIALGVGAAGGLLSAQVQDNRQRDSLLAAERSELALAAMRIELAKANLAQIRQKYDVGYVGLQALEEAQAELRSMQSRLTKVQIDIEEIQATARAPRDDLAAPRFGERDYVRERLQLEVASVQQRLVAAENIFAEAERRQRVGATSALAIHEPRAELARAKANLELLIGKLELRQAFVQQRVTGAEVVLRFQRLEMQRELAVAILLHELAEERLAQLRHRRDVGTVEQVEVLRAELRTAELAAEIHQISAALGALDQP